MLGEWARAGLGLQRAAVWVETLQLAAGYGCAAWRSFEHLARRSEGGATLLLAYWVLSLPVIGQRIAAAAWQYPAFRNATLRVVEPLGAWRNAGKERRQNCRRIKWQCVVGRLRRRDGGRGWPHDSAASLVDAPGGKPSRGSRRVRRGKSTLAGLLLGWHRAAKGRVLVDGEPVEEHLDAVRRATAWVDPSVQLWNRSLYENLRYGSDGESLLSMGEVIDAAGCGRY